MAKVKKSKWYTICSKLKKVTGHEPDRQEKIDAVKELIQKGFVPGIPTPNLDSWRVEQLLETIDSSLEQLYKILVTLAPGPPQAAAYARGYAMTRKIRDVVNDHAWDIELLTDTWEQLISNQYEVEGVTNLKISGLGAVRCNPEPKADVVDREAFRLWCIKNGYEKNLMLAWNTTNADLKQRLEEGLPPQDGVEARRIDKVVFSAEESDASV